VHARVRVCAHARVYTKSYLTRRSGPLFILYYCMSMFVHSMDRQEGRGL
jgi:hypothetical protein